MSITSAKWDIMNYYIRTLETVELGIQEDIDFCFCLYLTYSRWAPRCYVAILPVVTKDIPISPRFSPSDFLSRCKFSTLTIRQPMVVFYMLTFS